MRQDQGTAAAKRHIDWALEHKINIVSGELHHYTAQPENATPAVKAFFKEVNSYAAQRGITVGMDGGLFRPELSCTRAQIVTFLYRDAKNP